jgi:NTP pyrophosphatase (non-canonical NTP hydrolase)
MIKTFAEYQELALRTVNESLTFEQAIANVALGFAGEAGEFCEAVKHAEFHGHPLDIDNLDEEASDLLWYIAMYATFRRISLNQLAQMNIDKLRKRYPDGFSTEASIARVDVEQPKPSCHEIHQSYCAKRLSCEGCPATDR